MFPLIDTDRRRGWRVPRLRRLRRPVAALLRAGQPGARGGCPGAPAHPGDRHRRRRAAGSRGCTPTAARSPARPSSNCGGMFAAEIGADARRAAAARADVAPVRRHRRVPRAPRVAAADAARPRPARLLPAGGRRPRHGRLRADRGTVDGRPPARTTPSRRTSTAGSCPRCWDRFEEITANSQVRVPADGRRRPAQGHQRAGGVHPGQRVPPRRDRGRRLLRRRRVLRARHRGRRRHRQGDGRVDRLRRPRHGRVAHGRPPVRARSTARRRTRWRARWRPTRPTTTSSTPARSARPAGRCGPARRTRGTSSTARRSARSPAGSGSTTTRPTPRRATSRVRPRGLGRSAVVAGHRGRAHRHAGRGRAVRRVVVREAAASPARTPPTSCEWVCDNDVARGVGDITYTQALNARGGIESRLHGDPARCGRRVPGRDRDGVRRRTTRPGCGGRPGGATPPCGSTTSPASS